MKQYFKKVFAATNTSFPPSSTIASKLISSKQLRLARDLTRPTTSLKYKITGLLPTSKLCLI